MVIAFAFLGIVVERTHNGLLDAAHKKCIHHQRDLYPVDGETGKDRFVEVRTFGVFDTHVVQHGFHGLADRDGIAIGYESLIGQIFGYNKFLFCQRAVGAYDVILCGDGSADDYAQQVDVQLAAKLGIPVVNAAAKITPKDGALEIERVLEDVVETVEVSLPAVVSVTPDVALPRIPGMKDILAAGKKPMNISGAETEGARTIEVISCLAPEQADRKLEIVEASADGAIEQFAAALKAAL